jgi:hypothetical protein
MDKRRIEKWFGLINLKKDKEAKSTASEREC